MRNLLASRLASSLRRLGSGALDAVVSIDGNPKPVDAIYRDGRDVFGDDGAGQAVRRPYLLVSASQLPPGDAATASVTFDDPETSDRVTRSVVAVDPEASSGMVKLRLSRAS